MPRPRPAGICRDVRRYLVAAQEYHQAARIAAARGAHEAATELDSHAAREHQEAREEADLVDLLTLDSQTRWSW